VIWLLIHLHRRVIWIWLALAAVMAAIVTALWLDTVSTQAAVVACMTRVTSSSNPSLAACSPAGGDALVWFTTVNHRIQWALIAVPLLMGVFMAAPLMGRELENRTHRLVWTQGITPMQWFASNLASILMFCFALTAVLLVAAGLWLSLASRITNDWAQFDLYPPVFLSYVAFAVSLGLAVATVVGRTVPAMAVTGLIWIAIRGATGILARPMLIPALVRRDMSAATAGRDWFLAPTYLDSSGHQMSEAQIDGLLQRWGGSGADPITLLQQHGIFMAGLYQPASRFWVFQSIETFIFVMLSVGCILVSIAWVRLRLTSE